MKFKTFPPRPGYSSQSCQQLPVVESKRVKVTECQRCQRFYQEVLDVTTVRRCAPVYDERCRTRYPRQCVRQRQCTDVYVTECKDAHNGSGGGRHGGEKGGGKYQQKCAQVRAVLKIHS